MKTLMIMAATLALSACATGSVEANSPVGGVASYDSLKHARDACVKRGGEIVQRAQTTGKRLADFECKGK
ncbi:hypothetical protein [Phenylobacterium sp.]|uniref:hypothetical protein n=1 Tax=Phenylobacterium sp. TaxID=1871053 RepID=UPI00286A17FA|nr:hypothetical protein [Phenylobacterium sp.]